MPKSETKNTSVNWIRVSLEEFRKNRRKYAKLASSGQPVLVTWGESKMLLGMPKRSNEEIEASRLRQAEVDRQIAQRKPSCVSLDDVDQDLYV